MVHPESTQWRSSPISVFATPQQKCMTSRVANPAAVAQEAVFHVVLPDTGFISGFLMYGFNSFICTLVNFNAFIT